MTSSISEDSLSIRLRDRLAGVLGSLLPTGTRVALLGFPNHGNVGDSALWLGTRRLLADLGVDVAYSCEWRDYAEEELATAVAGGAHICLNGGGNFGDLWPGQQQLREHVLSAFSTTRTIQLPQSLWFERPENLDRVRRLVDAHDDLTLLVRETNSLDLATDWFQTSVALVPDAAFGLAGEMQRSAAECDLLVVRRGDKEGLGWPDLDVGDGVETTDWLLDTGPLPSRGEGSADDHYLQLAAHRVQRGLDLLSRARMLVTDRLHVHLFAVMLGIPHVVIDNSYGKVSGTLRSWTSVSGLALQAHAPEDVPQLLERLG